MFFPTLLKQIKHFFGCITPPPPKCCQNGCTQSKLYETSKCKVLVVNLQEFLGINFIGAFCNLSRVGIFSPNFLTPLLLLSASQERNIYITKRGGREDSHQKQNSSFCYFQQHNSHQSCLCFLQHGELRACGQCGMIWHHIKKQFAPLKVHLLSQ